MGHHETEKAVLGKKHCQLDKPTVYRTEEYFINSTFERGIISKYI